MSNPSSAPGPSPSWAMRFRKSFVTGLLVLGPVWLTGYIVLLVVRFLGGFLSPLVHSAAIRLLGESHWPGLVTAAAELLGFAITVVLIALVGYAVRKVVGRRAVEIMDGLLSRIPVVREIYKGVRRFTEVLLGDKSGFQRVVAVRFPTERTWSVGFITSRTEWRVPEGSETRHVAVFVPTSPNPTTGFLLLCEPADVTPLSLSVDEAIKLIVSGGALVPERIASA